MTNVVASSGTALTEEQVKLLKRYSEHINMAFDADVAGEKAAKRGISVAIRAGMSIKVIHIPNGAGKDPDECIKKDPNIWLRAVDEAEDVMKWYFRIAFEGKDVTNPKDKQAIANALLPEIQMIPYALEREHWLSELAGRLRVDVAILRQDMPHAGKEANTRPKEPEVSLPEKPRVQKELSRLEQLLTSWLALMLRFPQQASFVPFSFDEELFPLQGGELYNGIKSQYTTSQRIDVDEIRRFVGVENSGEKTVDVLLMKGELDFGDLTAEEAGKEIAQLANQIQKDIHKKKRKEIEFGIAEAEKRGDTKTVKALLKAFQSAQGGQG
jgi:DNA primase